MSATTSTTTTTPTTVTTATSSPSLRFKLLTHRMRAAFRLLHTSTTSTKASASSTLAIPLLAAVTSTTTTTTTMPLASSPSTSSSSSASLFAVPPRSASPPVLFPLPRLSSSSTVSPSSTTTTTTLTTSSASTLSSSSFHPRVSLPTSTPSSLSSSSSLPSLTIAVPHLPTIPEDSTSYPITPSQLDRSHATSASKQWQLLLQRFEQMSWPSRIVWGLSFLFGTAALLLFFILVVWIMLPSECGLASLCDGDDSCLPCFDETARMIAVAAAVAVCAGISTCMRSAATMLDRGVSTSLLYSVRAALQKHLRPASENNKNNDAGDGGVNVTKLSHERAYVVVPTESSAEVSKASTSLSTTLTITVVAIDAVADAVADATAASTQLCGSRQLSVAAVAAVAARDDDAADLSASTLAPEHVSAAMEALV